MPKPLSTSTSASKIPYSELPTTVQQLFKEEPEILKVLRQFWNLYRYEGDEVALLAREWEQYPDKIQFLGRCYTRLLAEMTAAGDLKTAMSGEGFDQDHIRDPDNICRAYVKGPRLREATCEGDNHYLCGGCQEHCIVSVPPK